MTARSLIIASDHQGNLEAQAFNLVRGDHVHFVSFLGMVSSCNVADLLPRCSYSRTSGHPL
ncbi:hypothetical protein CPB84DRAFT_1779335 [Gymnopilus junonius]|uniref:Uncharacterized protein n=1 Tax=Gymnopilus junonius TaxID=109634 RepID=A0A9P5TMT4_GYMJU|nr:hypothetical protein CPB84DRAFT_1779335 [Gymnopilus junonius]